MKRGFLIPLALAIGLPGLAGAADRTEGLVLPAIVPPSPAMSNVRSPAPPLSFDLEDQPKLGSEDDAKARFRTLGITEVRDLQRVGDYWEALAIVGGRPAAAYLRADGSLSVRHFPPEQLYHQFGNHAGGGRL